MNKKGFTLVELLAVIAVLGIVAGIGTVSVIGIINRSRRNVAKENVANLKDAAKTYCIEYDSRWSGNQCAVTVSTLKTHGDFNDDKNRCTTSARVIVELENVGAANEDYTARIDGYTSSNEYKVCDN